VRWVVEQLQKRFLINNAQDAIRKAAVDLSDNPKKALWQLLEDTRAALDGGGGHEQGVRVWDALDLNPAQQPRWLASRRLPRAAVTLLLGDEGIGKSVFWCLLVAHITTGNPFREFGIPAREAQTVVLVLTEDDWAKDVRPRLELAGADLRMIKVICTEQDGSGSPIFPRDMHQIDAIEPPPALVVVDCWLDTVPSGQNLSDPQVARESLHPWRDLAIQLDAAVLLLGHTNRVASANPRDKYGATYALRQKARMTLFAQLDQDGLLQIGPEKSNRTAILSASTFEVQARQVFAPIVGDDGTVEDDGKVALLVYRGESTKTAGEHSADNYTADHDTSGQHDALAWLAAFLGAGPRWSVDIHAARETAEISIKKLKTAKRNLNVESTRLEGAGAWFMRPPQHADRIPDGPAPETSTPDASEGTSEHLGSSEGDSGDVSGQNGTSCRSDGISEDEPGTSCRSEQQVPFGSRSPSQNIEENPSTSQDVQKSPFGDIDESRDSGTVDNNVNSDPSCGVCSTVPCLCAEAQKEAPSKTVGTKPCPLCHKSPPEILILDGHEFCFHCELVTKLKCLDCHDNLIEVPAAGRCHACQQAVEANEVK
jgi:hypothetical protein